LGIFSNTRAGEKAKMGPVINGVVPAEKSIQVAGARAKIICQASEYINSEKFLLWARD
jgi:hypothetical protein